MMAVREELRTLEVWAVSLPRVETAKRHVGFECIWVSIVSFCLDYGEFSECR